MTSQSPFIATAARRATHPGSISSSDSQNPLIAETCRHNWRRWRAVRRNSLRNGASSEISSGTKSDIDAGAALFSCDFDRVRSWPKSFSASRISAISMSARTPSRSNPTRSAIVTVVLSRRCHESGRALSRQASGGGPGGPASFLAGWAGRPQRADSPARLGCLRCWRGAIRATDTTGSDTVACP